MGDDMKRKIVIHAEWDGSARVWVATSDDVPGLATEAATAEELIKKLQRMIPELLALNKVRKSRFNPKAIPFVLESEHMALCS